MKPKPVVVLGCTGYIGSAFMSELHDRAIPHIGLSRSEFDYTNFTKLNTFIGSNLPGLVINCAAFIPNGSVDLCKNNLTENTYWNFQLPVMVSSACEDWGVTFAQIGTACLYNDHREYSEKDKPNRDFEGYCGVYLRAKYESEIQVSIYKKSYVWRIRLPFDEKDSPRNYLCKLRDYAQIWNQSNSLTHRGDFVNAALEMWKNKAPYGVYNMVNPGTISAGEIVEMMGLKKEFVDGPVSGSRLSCAKLESTGVKMRPVEEAMRDSIYNWVL